MNTLLTALVAAVAAAVSLWKWLRVSQREHYIPGSAFVTARRWARRRPPNALLLAAWVVPAVTAWVAEGGLGAACGALAAGVGACWPFGLSLMGDPRLKWTRRALRLSLGAGVLAAAALVAVGVVAGRFATMATAPVAALVAVDLAAALLKPLEARSARKFQRLASSKLDRARPRVVAITGSYGKTSVKNHVRDLAGATFETLATPASWNNVAGLSRAINEYLSPSTEVFVAEMGTYGPGEIQEMVDWLHPQVAVITTIAPVHLERMGTLDNVLAAKSEITVGAEIVVLNVDDPRLEALADTLRAAGSVEVWSVTTDPHRTDADVLVSTTTTAASPQATFVVDARGERLGTLDAAALHATNIGCAVAVALALGVERSAVEKALANVTSPTHRAAVATTEQGVVVVDDTFNSNPDGARAAVSLLASAAVDGRRYVVTPGMVEMGPQQDQANRELARLAAESGAHLVVVGWTNRHALLEGCPGAVTVADRDAARAWLSSRLQPGDGVLWENDLPDHYP